MESIYEVFGIFVMDEDKHRAALQARASFQEGDSHDELNESYGW